MRDTDGYLALVTGYHRARPKFVASLSATVSPLALLQTTLGHLPLDFDIDLAIGVQLDVVGEWVGRSRLIPVPIKPPWFTIGDPIRGIGAGYLFKDGMSFGEVLHRLDDETYRRLLYAKIAANNWDGSAEGALAAYAQYYEPAGSLMVVQDDYDMSMIVGVAGKTPDIPSLFILAKNLIPAKPMGVKTRYAVATVDGAPLFGIGVQNARISGIGTGAMGAPPEYVANKSM